MSDTEENPPEETGESVDTEKEEEYNPSSEEENLQQSLTEDTVSWEEPQEEEGQIEDGKRARGEEEEPGEGEKKGGTVTKQAAKKSKKLVNLDDIVISSESSTSASSLTETSQSNESSIHSQSPEVSEMFREVSPNIEITEAAAVGYEEGEMESLRWKLLQEVKEEAKRESGLSAQDRRDRGSRNSGKLSFLLSEEGQISSQFKGSTKMSMVSTSTEDTLFQKEEVSKVYPLTMTWSFGWNSFLPVYYIRDNQRVILYICAHTAIIYNVFKNTQYHLQGHPNIISCLCVSEDRRWVATADKGPDCLIIIWDSFTGYIVTGDIKGSIKFYDHTLSVVNWYSNFKLGAIRTLSFSKAPASPPTEKSNLPIDCTLKGDLFVVRNFIIGTFDATVYHMTADGTKLEKLFVEPRDAVYAISCHPYQPLIAVGSVCGMIKVWDYEKKMYLFSRAFEKGLGVQSLTYNPEGSLLGAGFTEGTVYILDAMSLENEIPEPFKYSRTSVSHVSFSHDSNYMATADVSFTVAVYKVVVINGQRVWEYLARLRSHHNSIQSLLFGVHLDSNEPRLLSLGKDRFLIEYNLIKSYKDHLEVLDIHRTDQGTYPTCMIWYPPLTKELFLLVCNSCYKVKLFNSTTKMCRKTLLGPAYGSPIQHTQVLPVKNTFELQKRHLVFINNDKVGLQILPVDGNPHKTCAIICHPSGVAGMALSYDGRYAFTAGGQDCSVAQWEINLSALEAAVSLGGEDLTPFYGLVSGGREGKFYRELEDYFYYSQLRSQGIDTMETRQVSEHICLSELPFVMRAIGFYPSEEKIEDMFNEIKFSEYVDTGNLIDKINLPDFLKVYLNHRLPFGNTLTGIQESFNILGFKNSEGKMVIRREDFLNLLLTKGEHMTEEEMYDCFATLFGLKPEGWKLEPASSSVREPEICLEDELPEEITAEIFATEILGLTISDSSGLSDQ
ncbi:cilia- and flagella-associated protein 251 [Onychomys torridus]|uniref:cilia- and flagella-associated protein 251 n=1 Tax=Onychomys torridus TaxID=38674 RepID=UPI00167FA6A8|nr:cilia- and flagella-associated protein 251 [Onychomys torridus]